MPAHLKVDPTNNHVIGIATFEGLPTADGFDYYVTTDTEITRLAILTRLQPAGVLLEEVVKGVAARLPTTEEVAALKPAPAAKAPKPTMSDTKKADFVKWIASRGKSK